MRLHPTVGGTMLRVVPPCDSSPGYCQIGEVISVDEQIIVLQVQADLPRKMRFCRNTGYDQLGVGSFIVRLL